jgi:serine/threonine protein kinase
MSETTGSVGELLVAQRRGWQRGEPLAVEACLARQPALAADADAVLDLIGHELLLRQEHGERPDPADYVARFPALASRIRMQFEVEQALDPPTLLDTGDGPERTPTLTARSVAPDAAWPAIPGYEILGVLGRGAMGLIYKARHLGLNRLVAVKMILAGPAADADERTRFQHEAEAVARLQHPNIVQIHDVGEHHGQPYLALEYVPGGTLADRLAGQPQPPHEAAALVATLARAMHHAHENGIVHRDLKPANVLMVSGGVVSGEWSTDSSPTTHYSPLTTHQPKIADFGLAKRLQSSAGLTRTGYILGTPAYMAPEQAAGQNKDVGPAADVYGLGAILYEMLTGRPPFRAEADVMVLQQVLDREPARPRRFAAGVPRDLETICLKCLHKQPAQRYASAVALAEDLERFLAGQSIRARPLNVAQRLWRCTRRHRALAVAGAVAVLALAVAVVVVLQTPAERVAYVERPPVVARPPVPRANGALLFKDDFDGKGPPAEALFGDNWMTLERADGAGRLTALKPGVLPALYAEKWQDFAVEFDLELPADAADAGLIFRCVRQGGGLPQYSMLLLRPRASKVDLNRFHVTGFFPLTSAEWKPGEPTKAVSVRLEAVGKNIRVFLDGKLCMEATDIATPAPGLIALTLHNPDETSRTVVFRNLRVYQLEP